MMAGSVRVWYFAEELISHKKVIPASAPTQTSRPVLKTQTIWLECSNTDYSIRDPLPQSSHFLSSSLPSFPLLSCFSPSTLHTHPVCFPSPTPQPYIILLHQQELTNMIFFFSVVVFVRPYRVIWKKADGCHSST